MKYRIMKCDSEGVEVDFFIVEGYAMNDIKEKAVRKAEELGWDLKDIKTAHVEV